MSQEEYQTWVFNDTVKILLRGVIAYVLALSAYWQFVG